MGDMKHKIEEFSAIFAFGHSATSSTNEGDLCYEICSCRDLEYDQIFDAVQILSLKYKENFFETILALMRRKEILASKKKIMCFVLARCQKLSETPSLFSFLVVCTFIDTVVFCVCNDVECFKVVKMASKCVTAAFKRWYVDLFDKENGFEGFSTYCEKLNATVLNPSLDFPDCEADSDSEEDSDGEADLHSEDSLDLEGFEPPDTDEVIELLKGFGGIEESDFALTDFEKKLLYDREELPSDIHPAEDVFIPSHDSSKSRVVENLELSMKNLKIKSKKVLKRAKKLCTMCKENCYRHVVFAAKELKVTGT